MAMPKSAPFSSFGVQSLQQATKQRASNGEDDKVKEDGKVENVKGKIDQKNFFGTSL